MALPDSYRRANELVGQYMNTWAIVEIGLGNVISAAFHLDGLYGSVFAANTTVRDKIAIARTGITLCFLPRDWKAMADHVLLRVADASTDRNMIAHTLFDAADDGTGVVFLRRIAKSEFRFEDTLWSEAKFDETFAWLLTLRRHLNDIELDLRDIPMELIRSVLDGENPTMPICPPVRLSVELPQPQNAPNSDQPKPKPKRERKQVQREKEVQLLRQQVAELRAALARFGQ